MFNEAIKKAPCVLLVDELDGISSRASISDRYAEYWTQIVNLMLEMVTQATATAGLVMVGATNYVERIDPALTLSGRLDHTIAMKRPSSVCRWSAHSGGAGHRRARTANVTVRGAGSTFERRDVDRRVINLGSAAGAAASEAGQIIGPQMTFGASGGTGTLVFNHTGAGFFPCDGDRLLD